jgi:hypothetical protein
MNKKLSRKILWTGIIVVLLMICLPKYGQVVQANGIASLPEPSQSLKKCYALDIIFLIDQSNSMSGTATSPANDKFDNRIEAYQIAVEWLAQNQFSMCQGAIHRVGVISFGGEAEVDLEMKNIPSDHSSWESIRASIKEALTKKRLGNTDHALAFSAAKEMLDRNPAPESSIPRKTAVVMLTDGMPCVPSRACDAGPQMKTYLNLMEQQVDKDFPFSEALLRREAAIRKQVEIYGDFNQIPEEVMSNLLAEYEIDDVKDLNESTYIYILALNDAYAYLDEVGGTFSSIAQKHGGALIDLANNTSEIPLQFNEVLSRLAMIKIDKSSCGTFYVQPYLSGLTLNVYKSAEGIPITISYNGYSLEGGKGDDQYFGMDAYETYGATNENYKFISPKAGEWKIDATVCDELHVVYQTFVPDDIQMIEPHHALPLYDGSQGFYNPKMPFYLAYTIKDTAVFGKVAKMIADSDYPIQIAVDIVKPDKTVQSTSLHYDAATETWKSVDPIPVDQVGKFEVAIVSATAACVDPDQCQAGAPFEIFGEGISIGQAMYAVNQVGHFGFSILEPEAAAAIPLHGSLIKEKYTEQEIPVKIQLQNDAGLPLSYKEIFGDAGLANQAFEANLSLAGKNFGPILLMVDQRDEKTLVGSFEINDLSLKGEGTIRVELTGDYLYEKYLANQTSQNVNFLRKDPLWRNPYVLIGIAALIGLILIGIIVWFIYHRSRPLSGYLEFNPTASEGRPLQISIAKKWDKNVIVLPPQLMIGKATIKNLDGKSNEISMTFKNKGKEETMQLKANQNKSMPGGIPYQVRYHGNLQNSDRPTGPAPRPYDRPYGSSGGNSGPSSPVRPSKPINRSRFGK